MYGKYIKRLIDLFLSLSAFILLFPLILLLTLIGAIVMRGNPFFIQKRPGRRSKKTGNERILSLIKFRTMTNAKGRDGSLLSDDERLVPYGRFLRSTSLDELPSLINIINGDMSLVGPRPLLCDYLPYYTETERQRHDIRPGLTGWAQVNGRNALNWEQKFAYDLEYIEKCSFAFDMKIIFMTVGKVFKRSDVLVGAELSVDRFDIVRKEQTEKTLEQAMHN